MIIHIVTIRLESVKANQTIHILITLERRSLVIIGHDCVVAYLWKLLGGGGGIGDGTHFNNMVNVRRHLVTHLTEVLAQELRLKVQILALIFRFFHSSLLRAFVGSARKF